MGVEEAGARELDDLGLRDFGIEGPFEIRERFLDRDVGLFQTSREEPIGPSRELVVDEQLEKLEMWERRGFRLRHAARQRLDHAGEPQMAQARRELCIHRRKSSK